MKVHFIAIGGSIMHNLAIQMHELGAIVTGSDDEIYDPARTKLTNLGLFPDQIGWNTDLIHEDLDMVILGMHARANNPELIKAQELGLNVFSFPEFVGYHSSDKTRVVVAGSHGKTTTTAMIMHVLQHCGRSFDYMVGADIDGFDRMVRLSEDSLVVMEGDEYLSSALDLRPKFLHYKPNFLVITGIAWDHMNVFPTEAIYQQQFIDLLLNLAPECKVYYDVNDDALVEVIRNSESNAFFYPYQAFDSRVHNDTYEIMYEGEAYAVGVFGKHNMSNLRAAFLVCRELGVVPAAFFKAIASFHGASKRMEVLVDRDDMVLIRDFAHAPSKVRATLAAVRERYPDRKVIACAELHTYSSLNRDFLPKYGGSMNPADVGVVFYHPHTLAIKKMPPLPKELIEVYFENHDLHIIDNRAELETLIKAEIGDKPCVLLLMSSGTFDELDVGALVH